MRRALGFTLIELMITVAVIGILAAIGYPSYQKYIIRTNRAAAEQFMMTVANRQEQYRLDARTFASQIGAVSCGLGLTPPPELATRYTFAISNDAACPSATTYTITATAIGPQVSDGNLTLTHEGVKSPIEKWQK